MKDVSRKYSTLRRATARSTLRLAHRTVLLVRTNGLAKKDPLAVARVAAVQAAKDTSRIVPYCHPVPVDRVEVTFDLDDDAAHATVTVEATAKTGVEMEALTAAAVAALTLYDMVKGEDPEARIERVELLEKRGGKSDFAERLDPPPTAAVVVVSDSASAGEAEDRTGPMIRERLEAEGFDVVDVAVIPDEVGTIQEVLQRYARDLRVNLVLTTGGTGLGPRDVTPEATRAILDRPAPGIAEAIRRYGLDRTPRAMLSRGEAGTIGDTLVVNLPGSSRGVAESLDALFPGILHGLKMLRDPRHEDDRGGKR
jgi:molybdenum cofactor biosynthesis protein MoaC